MDISILLMMEQILDYKLACYTLPGIIALLLGLLSAFQLLHLRSGNGLRAFMSISGILYLGIRIALAVAAYFVLHELFIPQGESHPELLNSFATADLLQLFRPSVKHYILGGVGGIGSEIILRGVIHLYTSGPLDGGGQKEVMWGVQKLIKVLEDYACTKAAIGNAHRKNKLIDKYTPDCTFSEYVDGIERSLSSYNAEALELDVQKLRKEMRALNGKYERGGARNDRLFNQLMAAQIINTLNKKTLKYIYKKLSKERADAAAASKKKTGS